MREEWQRVQDESAQLETLRLAVAAETMALEAVRNQLRTRIRMAATEMLQVAESPDCLGQPVARGMPEKSRPVEPALPVEIAASATVVTATADAPLDGVAPAAEPVESPEFPAATLGTGEGFGNPEADAAFERFMSDEIEDEPSRDWILAG